MSKHGEHKCIDIQAAYPEMRQQLDNDNAQIEYHIKAVENRMNQITQTRKDFEAQTGTAEQWIHARHEELKEFIDAQRNQSLTELSRIRDTRLRELDTLREESEHELLMMKSFERYWSEMKMRGSACDVVQAATSIHARAQELISQHEKQHKVRDQKSKPDYCKLKFLPSHEAITKEINDIVEEYKTKLKQASTGRKSFKNTENTTKYFCIISYFYHIFGFLATHFIASTMAG